MQSEWSSGYLEHAQINMTAHCARHLKYYSMICPLPFLLTVTTNLGVMDRR